MADGLQVASCSGSGLLSSIHGGGLLSPSHSKRQGAFWRHRECESSSRLSSINGRVVDEGTLEVSSVSSAPHVRGMGPLPALLCSITLPSFPIKFPWDDDFSTEMNVRLPQFPPVRLNAGKKELETGQAGGTRAEAPKTRVGAEAPPPSSSGSTSSQSHHEMKANNAIRQRHSSEAIDETGSICTERTHGRQRVYRSRTGQDAHGAPWDGWEMVEDQQTYNGVIKQLVQSYLLPQGFPESVGHTYAPYMFWRGVQYFFGGAMSVFTTSSLLGALGLSGKAAKYKGEASAAINWVIKDGAGRMGRLLFARWGRELDCELKQFRLAGDLLMETGAALELATIFAPSAFLPLACTANLAKNLAAVAASSTRAPIYRTFALSNNLADITAKGESVANLADIIGTAAGIALSKFNMPMFPTFCVLSCGYLIASRKEVDSVELPYLNRARLAYATKIYLEGSGVPDVAEANQNEPLLPWGQHNQRRIVLGSNVEKACHSSNDLAFALSVWRDEGALLTYRPNTKTVHILLLEGTGQKECLRAAFAAHLFLHLLDGKEINVDQSSKKRKAKVNSSGMDDQAPDEPWHKTMRSTRTLVDQLLPDFLSLAEQKGWKLQQTMLNPKDTRVLRLKPLTM